MTIEVSGAAGTTIEELDKAVGEFDFKYRVARAYPALRAALLAARDYVHHYDCSGYTKLGDLKEITAAREALRAKLKEVGL